MLAGSPTAPCKSSIGLGHEVPFEVAEALASVLVDFMNNGVPESAIEML